MRPWRNKKIMLVLIILIWGTIFYSAWIFINRKILNMRNEPFELVWWTGIPGTYSHVRTCGFHTCHVSNKRSNSKKAQALLFYASDINLADEIPLPRKWFQRWALLHVKLPRNVPYVAYREFLRHFNYTATLSRFSSMPLTTMYLPRSSDLTSRYYQLTLDRKSIEQFNNKMATIVFLQSDCDTMSGREEYVRELMNYIRIDSFGKCLQNRDLPHR